MEKRYKIIIVSALVFLAVLTALAAVKYRWFQKTSENGAPGAFEQKRALNATAAEIKMVSGKTYEEVISDFNKDKEECPELFKDSKENDLLSVDRLQAISFVSCQAVKIGDAGHCDLLKNDEAAFNSCQEIAKTHLNFVFPLFTRKDCSLSGFSDEQKKLCTGLFSGLPSDCQKIDGSSDAQPVCLASVKNDVSVCDNAQNKQGCRDFYYFAKAAKANDISYLKEVKSGTNFALYSLFFDKNSSCSDLLKKFSDDYCSSLFSEEMLERRISIWSEVNKMPIKQNK